MEKGKLPKAAQTEAVWKAPDAAPDRGVKAALARVRGPTISEQRAMQEQAEQQQQRERAEARAAKKQQQPARAAPAGPIIEESAGAVTGRRGRVRANAAQITVAEQAGLAALVDRQRSLMAAGKYRRTRLTVAVAPAGTADISKCPDRTDYPAGEAGEGEYDEDKG